MALVRWQPRGRVIANNDRNRDEYDLFLDDFFRGAFRPRYRQRARNAETLYPRVDLRERADAVVLRAEVPGLTKEELTVTIHKDVVTLKGERREEERDETECFVCRETSAGSFERHVSLPQSIDADAAEAKLENGVLTLTLPKSGPAGAVKVDVN